MTRYPHVKVELIGEDGNAFNIIGRVAKAIARQVGPEASRAWTNEAFDSGSYDELLNLVQTTVVVI